MPHKKSPETFGNETLSSRKNYTKKPSIVKCNKKRLPPNGRFYQDVIDGYSQFPKEAVVLIYIGSKKYWEYEKQAISIGLQPPIVVDTYIIPKAFYWPVNGLRVRIIEWDEITCRTRDELAIELDLAGAIEIQYYPFGGVVPLRNPAQKVVCYE